MTIRQRIADCSTNPTLIASVLAQPVTPRAELVPCIIWNGGLSAGRPTYRLGQPRHPVAHYFPEAQKIRRVCAQKLCVNPHHFAVFPRPTGQLQHPLVFQAEETIHLYATLDEAYAGIDIPRQYVLAAWRNHRQLNLRPRR